MMSLRHLRYFVVITEEKSFVSAAKRLGTVQSSLSQQMKDLEDYVGVDLYERGRRIITLTPAGEVFLEEAKKTLKEAEKTLQMAQNLNTKNKNVIKIGILAGVEVKLPKFLLENFTEKSIPAVSIEIISGSGPELIHSLSKGLVDIAFTRSDLHEDDIDSFKYIEEELVFLHPKNHDLSHEPYISIKNLSNINLITPSEKSAPELYHQIKKMMEKNQADFRFSLEADNAFSTMSYVNMGLGCAILPDYIKSIKTEETILKQFTGVKPKINLYVNFKKSYNSIYVADLINFLRNSV